MSAQKPHGIRVRVVDGKPREWQKLKGLLGAHLDVHDAKGKVEFVICAVNEKQIAQARDKLGAVGLEEIAGGDTTIAARPPKPTNVQPARRGGSQHRGPQPQRNDPNRPQSRPAPTTTNAPPLPGKPYGFVPLPEELTSAEPVWHDGTSSRGRLSGEIRFELETLTPLLVGWERQRLDDRSEGYVLPNRRVAASPQLDAFLRTAAKQVYPDAEDKTRARKQHGVEDDRRKYEDRVRHHIVDIELTGVGWAIDSKSILGPLRAPWGERPVVIPGDSLKGLLRHELGALLGAPMERVAERSYSYRPNSKFANGATLIPRIARIPAHGVDMKDLDSLRQVRVPTRLELLRADLQFDSDRLRQRPTTYLYRFDDPQGASYRGGQGAGIRLNSKRRLHERLLAEPDTPTETVPVPETVQQGYLATLRHLTDREHGHFSERHPDVPNMVNGDVARERILEAAATVVFAPGDLIWVEWDTERNCIVSLGWHYYYRWAYTDTVRRRGGGDERRGLSPLPSECEPDGTGAPRGLSPVRRLFGYTGDNEGSAGIGEGDHAQLMGRVSVNAALEVVAENDTDDERFLSPTFLRELGMPRPSAVEHYIQQPHHPWSRRSDKATLVTYGDAVGYDRPGELAGRKFYLDRADAYDKEPWKDDSPANRANDRSTLALEASRTGRRFRFTLRFRDLDFVEVAAIVAALSPHQLRDVLNGEHTDGYCSKLGYARPLGWGTVRVEAKALLLLEEANGAPVLNAVPDVCEWVRTHYRPTTSQEAWLAVHRHKHPDAKDYPTKDGQIRTFHTDLRADHSRARRYRHERGR